MFMVEIIRLQANMKKCERCGRKIYSCQRFCGPCGLKICYNEMTKRFYKKNEFNYNYTEDAIEKELVYKCEKNH